MNTAAPQGIEIASANEFCDFTAREGSPAARYHEIFEISNFAPDLGLTKFCLKEFFWDTAAQPTPPTNISQQTDGRKLKSIGPILRNLRKRHEDARKFG